MLVASIEVALYVRLFPLPIEWKLKLKRDHFSPLALLGLLIIVLFFNSAKKNNDKEYRFMWLTIVLSFGFYIPVVLWADIYPMIGLLMMPKTCAYVWTVLIGYNSMKKALVKN